VIFTSTRTPGDNGYDAMMDVIAKLSKEQPGYLGRESARGADGFGISVIYYKDEASILAWKAQSQHAAAQRMGRERWYSHYEMRVCKVERAYAGPEGRG
jgi:heme-degrading monooxygenase HmoA